MSTEKLILISQLCTHYEVETSLFSDLQSFGIIEILTVNDSHFIHEDKIDVLEKIIRMKKDLNLNLEGIDVVLNLLDKIDELQNELATVKSRLRLYED